jgi:hypothetical protein
VGDSTVSALVLKVLAQYKSGAVELIDNEAKESIKDKNEI